MSFKVCSSLGNVKKMKSIVLKANWRGKTCKYEGWYIYVRDRSVT